MTSPEQRNAKLREMDIKIRLLLEAKKNEDDALAVAAWESQLPIKSLAAEKKRQAAAMQRQTKLLTDQVNQVRKQRMAALFAADDDIYEEELRERNLAFRKQRF
eukprot:CAMPEP_0185017732 /NCGR_PEP_ID=MMETSP1103-20130426/648_1 /TAXON_ID=36769 /ORGANISM="Paraphysomonas bandaiensis, Strain Caron Lab Isolate" /LENGTH=103 /DNA_ID=CAMNT_0027547293 /DNA_START=89 /DNA_END=403 /DNA_ORIENTATION=+